MYTSLARYLLALVLVSSSIILTHAQALVSGKVVEAVSGEGLPGVTIIVKGTTQGTTSLEDGSFEVAATADEVLVFSFIGMETIEVEVGSRTYLEVQMREGAAALTEVVVVGYGTQKRANLSGAVDNISPEQLEDRPISNISQGLQGLVPNFNVDFPGGEPGAAASFNIRGFTSINGGSPLFIVDGVAYEAQDLNFLNPNDIASLSVLKDAASAAIYGARAAFGVVLITTKKGKENKVTYTNFFASAQPTLLPQPITDPYIFLRIAELSTNNTPWDYNNYTDEEYKWARERSDNPAVESVRLDPNNPNQYAYMGSEDWNDYFFNERAFSQQHNLAFSGAKDNMNYFFSGNYAAEDGLSRLTQDDWKRYALRSNLIFKPFSWLSVENNTNIFQADRERPTYSLPNIYDLRPVDVATNPDGTWANTDAGRAAARIVDGGRQNSSDFGFQTLSRANISLFDGALVLTGDATFRRNFGRIHADGRPYNIGYGPADIRLEGGEGYAQEIRDIEDYNAYNVYGTLNKTFNRHQLQVVAGFNQERYIFERSSARRDRLIVGNLPYIGVASGLQTVSASYADWAVQGIFGRINYIFNNRYIVEFNGRYDGTSRFPSDARWGFFPSVSGAWIVSEENFLRGADDLISTLKLRGSYGSLGNQSVSNYGYILNLPSGTTNYLIDGDYRRFIGTPGLNVDPNNYTWEEVLTSNFGVELGLFKDKIFTSFDYYIRSTNGMLAPGQELPAVLGTSEPRGNVADLKTRGWELSLELRNRFNLAAKPFQFDVRLNVGDSRSEIINYPNEELLFSGSYYPGQEIGEIWGLESDGLFKTNEEISALDQSLIIPWGALSIVPGWPKFVDQDGNGMIEKGISVNDTRDFVKIGNSQPRYRFGVDMNANWNGFDFRAYFQGVGKRDYYPIHYLFWGLYQQPYANTYDRLMNFYRPEADSDVLRAQHAQAYLDRGLADANTDNPDYPILQAWLADYRVENGLAIPQTRYLLNAAYARLKNLTVGYTLPQSLTNKMGIGKFRMFLSGENLWEVSEIGDFIDPEAISTDFSNGGAWGGYAYPFQRRYSFGINIEF